MLHSAGRQTLRQVASAARALQSCVQRSGERLSLEVGIWSTAALADGVGTAGPGCFWRIASPKLSLVHQHSRLCSSTTGSNSDSGESKGSGVREPLASAASSEDTLWLPKADSSASIEDASAGPSGINKRGGAQKEFNGDRSEDGDGIIEQEIQTQPSRMTVHNYVLDLDELDDLEDEGEGLDEDPYSGRVGEGRQMRWTSTAQMAMRSQLQDDLRQMLMPVWRLG